MIHDPAKLAPRPLFLSPATAAVLVLLDGEHDLAAVQTLASQNFDQTIPIDQIENLIDVLDQYFFLEGNTFETRLAELKAEFDRASIRPAILAGQAYPADRDELNELMRSFYFAPGGPGKLAPPEEAPPPRAIVAPHIDFGRGGHCYAWAYQRIPVDHPPDLAVILGTAHAPTDHLLTLCRKSLQTPFGPSPLWTEAADALIDRAGDWILDDQFVHRGEHSVEFQAVWLNHRAGDRPPIPVLPLLCGSFHPLMLVGKTPADDPRYMRALAVIREQIQTARDAGRRVLIVAGVDFSHVGPQFGDPEPVGDEAREAVKSWDLRVLDDVLAGDGEGLFRRMADSRDLTRICGLPALYTLLGILDEPRGALLTYDQWFDENRLGLVSFAAAAFD
jgi:hypothetical protein